ncbi:MAG: NUDIX domain-containing protein, partial [Pseudomonadales bacterium]|nr:NUDIX domain-containing protein [Pseudomonadales bacterium]
MADPATDDPVVSSETDLLVLVDEADNALGVLDKAACHDGEGRLHRAFSVFVLDRDGRVLLQQRAHGKRLWPGYWS